MSEELLKTPRERVKKKLKEEMIDCDDDPGNTEDHHFLKYLYGDDAIEEICEEIRREVDPLGLRESYSNTDPNGFEENDVVFVNNDAHGRKIAVDIPFLGMSSDRSGLFVTEGWKPQVHFDKGLGGYKITFEKE